ncbi:MAG: DUF4097 family beta strand repeat protein, partial [candidate division Zixibacteria bacterium]|nr:DUF4097 family beta strand repeat protein [candidate division Zixibacteria bacterium]
LEALSLLIQRLNEGAYRANIRTLERDLDVLSIEFEKQWTEKRAKLLQKRAQVVAQCMQQELSVLQELLEEDVLRELALQPERLEDIEIYLSDVFDNLYHESDILVHVNVVPGDVIVAVSDISDEPLPPEPPQAIHLSKSSKGQIEATWTLVDSSLELSSGTAVYVVAPMGQLKIEGWSKDKVVASLEIELATDCEDKAKAMSDEISIGLDRRNNKLRIEPRLPAMSDLSTSVVHSSLRIKMPRTSYLVCEMSFGDLMVTNLDNGAEITAHKSRVTADRIVGKVELSTSLCKIAVAGIDGTLSVANSMGPIKIENCTGTITLANHMAPIILSGSDAKTKIKNNGDISVLDHVGPLVIRNSNGKVDVSGLEGDLTVHTSFKPLFIEDVTGDVELNNTHAPINVLYVDGSLSAHNRSSDIIAEGLTGPLDLSANGGDIDIILDRLTAKRSSIEASSGDIILTLSPDSDLHLLVETSGGTIINLYDDTESLAKGRTKELELSLGRTRHALNVTGKQSDITIERAH